MILQLSLVAWTMNSFRRYCCVMQPTLKKSDNYIGLYAFMVPRFLRVEICIRVPSTWCSKLLVVDMKPMNGYVDCIPYLEVLQCYAYKVTCLSWLGTRSAFLHCDFSPYLNLFEALTYCYMAVQSNLRPGNLLRFAVKDERVKLVDGKMEISELQFVGKPNRARAFADSHSKVSGHLRMHFCWENIISFMPCSQWFDRLLYVQALFQYAARHAPLRIEDLVASIQSDNMELESTDVEMQGWWEGINDSSSDQTRRIHVLILLDSVRHGRSLCRKRNKCKVVVYASEIVVPGLDGMGAW